MNAIEDSINLHLRQYFADIMPVRLLVGVSGGCDSMVLLSALRKQNVDIVAAHVNYHTRGEASDADEELVRKTCASVDVPLSVRSAPANDWSFGNFQDRARTIRFEFFRELVAQHHCQGIALGHHQDDQVETVMLKWLRAAGIGALSGMTVWEPESGIFRPLLDFSRVEIESYARINNIRFREDASNQSDDYARNWLRNTFGGKLDELIPGWHANVIKQSRRAAAQSELNQLALRSVFLEDEFSLSVAGLMQLHPEARAIIAASWLTLHRLTASEGQLQELSGLCESQTGSKVQINSTFTVWRDRNVLRIVPGKTELNTKNDGAGFEKPSATVELSDFLSGRVFKVFSHSKIGIEVALIPLRVNGTSTGEFSLDPEALSAQARNGMYYLDAKNIRFPIRIRPWSTGDRFSPIGLSGTRKISDFLTDRKIRPDQKNRALVITGFDEKILAVIFPHQTQQGLYAGIAGDFKLTASTNQIIRITVIAPK
jgi:tRNA(Ile)-lysidine synthase